MGIITPFVELRISFEIFKLIGLSADIDFVGQSRQLTDIPGCFVVMNKYNTLCLFAIKVSSPPRFVRLICIRSKVHSAII